MSDPKYKVVELSRLKFEDGAHELASSSEMQPYMKLAEAVVITPDAILHVPAGACGC